MTYNEAVYEIEEIPKYTTKNPLEETRGFYEFIQDNYNFKEESLGKIVHVAGTNGKGSVCSFLNSICISAGLRTGMFISPHLITTRERFIVDNEIISEEEFVEGYERLKKAVDEYNQIKPDYHPTYFEILFFIMLFLFKDKKLDYLILETGLGGRLDTTNVFSKPSLTIITEIGFDHMAYLGNTLEKIASEKAGIIKKDCPLVFFDKREETSKVIEDRANELGVDYIKTCPEDIKNYTITKKCIDFSVLNRYYEYDRLKINISAVYQLENANLALAGIHALNDSRISRNAVIDGIQNMRWPGRMEELIPGVYVDGAHNEDGIEAFAKTLDTLWRDDDCVIVFSAVNDKDYDSMIKTICGLKCVKDIVVTHIPGSRGTSTEQLTNRFREYTDKEITICERIEEAIDTSLAIQKRGENKTVFFVGSLYLVGFIKDILCEKGLEK